MYSDHGGQKKVLDSLELELQMGVNGHVGAGNLASETAARVLNYRAISLAPRTAGFLNRN